MKDNILESLVSSGTIKDYEYTEEEDVNRYNETIYSEKLVICFPDGRKLTISSNQLYFD